MPNIWHNMHFFHFFKEKRLTTGIRFIVQIKNINDFFFYFILNGLDGMRTNECLPDRAGKSE